MNIVFDLDGVIRDLNSYLGEKYKVPFPTDWKWEYKGKNVFNWIEFDNFNPLLFAPPTEYYPFIYSWKIKYNFKGFEIWTSQPEKWRK